MIRSKKERHFVHHAMVKTLFQFFNVSCIIYPLFLSLSLLFPIETLLSPLNQSSTLCVFYATFHFALFLFLAADDNILQTIVTTHAVCKKLNFKRVLTLSLRMTDACHILISMLEPCKRMSLFCFRFYKISEGKVFYAIY